MMYANVLLNIRVQICFVLLFHCMNKYVCNHIYNTKVHRWVVRNRVD